MSSFVRVGEVEFLGRRWFGYGNAALLDLPVIEAFRCSRTWTPDGAQWREAVARAERIGPGGAGFVPRWHPGRKHEPFCAAGRMLFLSLWPEMAREPTNAELYARCHEMGDIVLAGIPCARRGGNS